MPLWGLRGSWWRGWAGKGQCQRKGRSMPLPAAKLWAEGRGGRLWWPSLRPLHLMLAPPLPGCVAGQVGRSSILFKAWMPMAVTVTGCFADHMSVQNTLGSVLCTLASAGGKLHC